MEQELKRYLIDKCRDWMLPEEVEVLDQLTLAQFENEQGTQSPKAYRRIEVIYGINCKKTEQLMLLGKEKLEEVIATRLLTEHKDVLHNCPVCDRLTRTPKAKQCRHCEHRWFEVLNIMVGI